MFAASAHDPFRTPDYRWSRAGWLIAEGRNVRRAREDAYVVAALDFRRASNRATTGLAQERLANRMPGIYFAAEVFRRDEDYMRWVLEARILTNEPVKVIARRCRTTPEVVYWYEKLFFDVRPYLNNRDWLVSQVLVGESFRRGLQERDRELLLKLYALVGGPLAVDAILQLHNTDRPFPRTREELDAFWGDDHRETLRMKAALAARCLPINMSTHQAILEAHHRLVALEKETAAASDATGLLVKNVATALTSLPFRVHVQGESVELSGSAVYDDSAAELRADEVFTADIGGTVDASSLRRPMFPAPTAQEKSNG